MLYLIIITNEIVYAENPIPVNVNIKITGYPDGDVKVRLLDNGIQFSEQTIKLNSDKADYSLLFEYNPMQEGIHKITASVNPFEGEIT